jgi:hypothetical protein
LTQWRQGGIEEQTRKLFEVCRLRDVPILTFVNKLDREGRDLSDRPMMILKSPVSSVMFRDSEIFTDGRLSNGVQSAISDDGRPKAWRVATTRRGKLAADLLQKSGRRRT